MPGGRGAGGLVLGAPFAPRGRNTGPRARGRGLEASQCGRGGSGLVLRPEVVGGRDAEGGPRGDRVAEAAGAAPMSSWVFEQRPPKRADPKR